MGFEASNALEGLYRCLGSTTACGLVGGTRIWKNNYGDVEYCRINVDFN